MRIDMPRDNSLIYNGSVPCSGRLMSAGFSISVNGRLLAVAADGSFRESLTIPARGRSWLKYVCTSPAGGRWYTAQPVWSADSKPGRVPALPFAAGRLILTSSLDMELPLVPGWFTSRLELTLNGTTSRLTVPRTGRVRLPLTLQAGRNSVSLRARNALGWKASPPVTFFAFRTRPAYGATAAFIAIDRSERKLYFFKGGRLRLVFPVAVGKPSTPTPIGDFRIMGKSRGPTPGFGPLALWLFRWSPARNRWLPTIYGIHGTNKPWSIGTMASHGCIRNYNRNIIRLYPQVPKGTHVVIVP